MSVSLYELLGNFRAVLEMEVDSPEDAEAMIALLDETEGDMEVKISNIGYIIHQAEVDAEVLKVHEAKIHARRKVFENKAKWLKDYAMMAMNSHDMRKIERVDITVRIQKNAPSLRILDEEAVPDTFKIPQLPKIDAVPLKNWVANHPECDFAWLEAGEHLRVVIGTEVLAPEIRVTR